MPVTFANAIPVQLRSLGIAKEATKGTPVTTPANYIPIEEFNPVDVIDPLMVRALFGSMVTDYGYQQGIKAATFEIRGNPYVDTWGYGLAGLMGVDDVTGASAPYTHKLTVKNNATGQPTAHTLLDSYGASQARAYSACTWSAAEFTFAADRLVDCTLRGIALASQQETNGSPSYSAVQPFPTWQFTLTIGGTATAVYVTTLTVTIERQNVPIKAINGTQNPAELFAGYQRCTWRFTALADPSDTALNYYLNNTQPSMSIAATTGAGASAQGLTIESHQVAVTRANLTQTGEYLSVEAEGTAIGNTADVGTEAGEGVAVITLENAFPAGTYV